MHEIVPNRTPGGKDPSILPVLQIPIDPSVYIAIFAEHAGATGKTLGSVLTS